MGEVGVRPARASRRSRQGSGGCWVERAAGGWCGSRLVGLGPSRWRPLPECSNRPLVNHGVIWMPGTFCFRGLQCMCSEEEW